MFSWVLDIRGGFNNTLGGGSISNKAGGEGVWYDQVYTCMALRGDQNLFIYYLLNLCGGTLFKLKERFMPHIFRICSSLLQCLSN